MKLKQALIIGLSSAILAIPAIAAESATDLNSLPAANTSHPAAAAVTPAKKETVHHQRGHKKISMEKKMDPKQEKGNTKLAELNTLNSDNTAGTDQSDKTTGTEQTEKDSVKS